MKNPGQFGSSKALAKKAEPGGVDCAIFEQLLAEFAENGLPDTAIESLRTHGAQCAACTEKLAQARRGREWLLVLKQEALEPPAGMVARILARTSHAGAPGSADVPAGAEQTAPDSAKRSGVWASERQVEYILPAYEREAAGAMLGATIGETDRRENIKTARRKGSGSTAPAWQRNTVVVLRKTLVEPRLAMMAAMAFFSITLTLNLAGVRLTNLRPADLAPSNMRRAASRQYAEVNARMARYYENLRIVYEVEARVQQLRRAAATNPQPQAATRPRKSSSNSSGDDRAGDARHPREGMVSKHSVRIPRIPDPAPVRTGPRMDAALHLPDKMLDFSLDSLETTATNKYVSLFCNGYFSRRSLFAPERGFA